jgi:hypothetical protein
VYQYFPDHDGVFGGTIAEYDQRKGGKVGEHVFRVDWDDGWDGGGFAYGHEEMDKYAIRFVDGAAEGPRQPRQDGIISQPTRTSTGRPAQFEIKGGDPDGMQSAVDDTSVQWVQTDGHESWTQLCARWSLTVPDQRLYFKWLNEKFQRGNSAEFTDELGNARPGCVCFPNPMRVQNKRRKGRPTRSFHFAAGTKMPVPAGSLWDAYANRTTEMSDNEHDQYIEALVESAANEVELHVIIDYEEFKAMMEEQDNVDVILQQVELAELCDVDQIPANWAVDEDQRYVDKKTGLPIAPKSVIDLIKRGGNNNAWWEALKKEKAGFDKHGTFEYMTYDNMLAKGITGPGGMPVVPMRMLMDVKIDSGGNFSKVKCREVLQGSSQNMQKGVHYSVVFSPSPSIAASRLLQAKAIGENKNRFVFDIDQAFLNGEARPEEQVPVRFSPGTRKYCPKTGKELYGILKRNIYGSPLAMRNWSACRNEWMLNVMGKDKGWVVSKMEYEPCMFKVVIDDRVTWLVIHVDDVDGISDDPRDSAAIMTDFQDRFGITIGDHRYLLGVQRDVTVRDGIGYLHMSQAAYMEQAWVKFGHFRAGASAPTTPSDGLKFTDGDGKPLVQDKVETDAVQQRGYRELVGTLLWPMRNSSPTICHALTQLCRVMHMPSEVAWEQALQCLHYLYDHRTDGITFRSDGDPDPKTYYDSGHNQDRLDYKNQYGFVVMMYGGPVIWQSKKHNHCGGSAAEDEYMTLGHAARQVMWLRNLLKEMGDMDEDAPASILLGDNRQADKWGQEDIITDGNRFIGREYMKVRDWVRDGQIEPRWIGTKSNLSDIFTKDVPAQILEELGPMVCGMMPEPPLPPPTYALDKEKEQHALEQERVLYERARTARVNQWTEFDWAERTEPGLQDLAQIDGLQPGGWE